MRLLHVAAVQLSCSRWLLKQMRGSEWAALCWMRVCWQHAGGGGDYGAGLGSTQCTVGAPTGGMHVKQYCKHGFRCYSDAGTKVERKLALCTPDEAQPWAWFKLDETCSAKMHCIPLFRARTCCRLAEAVAGPTLTACHVSDSQLIDTRDTHTATARMDQPHQQRQQPRHSFEAESCVP